MDNRRSAVALGLFDGVHIGHRAVLRLAAEQRKNGLRAAVFTFKPDAVGCKSDMGYICCEAEKSRLIELSGIEEIYSPEFSELRDMSGEDFAREILAEKMAARYVCCGRDFRFGRNGACGVDELRRFGERFGFEVCIAEDVYISGIKVSSSELRKALISGDMPSASALLGRPYSVYGEVVHGAHLGTGIGFPTINQLFGEGQLVPRYGVYASRVTIDGESFGAMTNIGVKPTVAYGGMPLAETNIIGYSGDLYGRTLSTELIAFIRPEQRFGSLDELKKQIADDKKAAEKLLCSIENSLG